MYQFEDRHFHHTLIEVGGLVLDYLHGDNLMRLHILTLDNLAESTLSENIQDKVSVGWKSV